MRSLRVLLIFAVLLSVILLAPPDDKVAADGLSTGCQSVPLLLWNGSPQDVGGRFAVGYHVPDMVAGEIVTLSNTTSSDPLDIEVKVGLVVDKNPYTYLQLIPGLRLNYGQTWQYTLPADGEYLFMTQFNSASGNAHYITFTWDCRAAANTSQPQHGAAHAYPINDGRINRFDHAAPVAVYCADSGLSLYAIDEQGHGSFAADIPWNSIQPALADAATRHRLITETAGLQLWALSDRSSDGQQQLQLMGPDDYVFIFPANTCGFAS
jgi:hypothetical protein